MSAMLPPANPPPTPPPRDVRRAEVCEGAAGPRGVKVVFDGERSVPGSCSGVTTGLPLADRADAPALRTDGVRVEERRGVVWPFLSSNHLTCGAMRC